jgi:hypothetical protein
MLEIENQQMKTIKEQRETELLRQIRHLQDDKEELQKKLDGRKHCCLEVKGNMTRRFVLRADDYD